MKKCNGSDCNRRTPDKIAFCCGECEKENSGPGDVGPNYAHSAICDAREQAARSGIAIPMSPVINGGQLPND